MGVITNCCTQQNITESLSISVYSTSQDEKWQKEDLYKNISEFEDISHAFIFITSKDYYPLILKKIPKHIISKKICQKLSNKDIMELINKLLNWIKEQNIDNFEEKAKKEIIMIKQNTGISLNYIIKKLKDLNFGNKTECFLIQALTSISLIVQCILFIINGYSTSIWGNKNIAQEAKKYAFQCAYFLSMTKCKYDGGGVSDNSKINNKVTKEVKEKLNFFYQLASDFTEVVINQK
jgi:hypothetical protein